MAEGTPIRLAQLVPAAPAPGPNQAAPAPAGAGRLVIQPGQTLPISAAQLERAAMQQVGNDLVVTLPDGSVIQVPGYFAGGGEPPRISLSDGGVITSQVLRTAGLGTLGSGTGAPEAAPRSGGLRGSTAADPLSVLLGDAAPDNLGGEGFRGLSRSDSRADLLGNIGSTSGTVQVAGLSGGISRDAALPTDIALNNTPPQVTTAAAQTALVAASANVPTDPTALAGAGANAQGGGGSGSGDSSAVTNVSVSSPAAASPTAGLSRAPFAQDAGNPGDSSPALIGLAQVGGAGNDTFNGSTNTYNTGTFNSGTNQFTIDDGSGAGTFDNQSGPTFTYNGQTIVIGNAATTFGGSWFTRPINDTYSGLGGDDTITGGSLTFGSGQDLLLGDFDLPASFGRLTTSTADDGPGTPGNDSLVGGSGADTLFGGGGVDTLMGGRDDDLLIVTDLNFALVDGGFGGDNSSTGSFPSNGLGFFTAPPANVTQSFDTLRIATSGVTIDLGQSSLSTKIQNIEGIDLATNGGNVFKATAAQIDSITNEDTNNDGNLGPDASTAVNDKTDTLFITGDNTDTVQLTGGGWGLAASGISGTTLEINVATTFSRYTNTGGSDGAGDTITVYVQTAVAVQLS